MKTKDDVEKEFMEKFNALLKEYKAEIAIEDKHGCYHIEFMIPAVYNDNHDCESEFTVFDIGGWHNG